MSWSSCHLYIGAITNNSFITPWIEVFNRIIQDAKFILLSNNVILSSDLGSWSWPLLRCAYIFFECRFDFEYNNENTIISLVQKWICFWYSGGTYSATSGGSLRARKTQLTRMATVTKSSKKLQQLRKICSLAGAARSNLPSPPL